MTPEAATTQLATVLREHQVAAIGTKLHCICGHESATNLDHYRHQVDALLAAHTDEACGTCGGTGATDEGITIVPCPDCVRGRVRGERVIVALTMERVPDMCIDHLGVWRKYSPSLYDDRALYVERFPDIDSATTAVIDRNALAHADVERLQGDQEP